MTEILYQFLQDAFTMPTTVFSILLILVAVYWMISVVFGLNLESVEGAAEAVDGLAEGALEGAADGVLDDAGGLGAGDEPGLFSRTGLSEMPSSLFLSLFVFFAWLFSFLGMKYVPQAVSLAFQGIVFALVVAGLAVVLGIGATLAALIPLARFFKLEPVTTSRDLVGRVCTVRTQRVTPTFGQATVEDGGSYLVNVRADGASSLTRGSRALIYDYDEDRDAFLVTPMGEGPAAGSASDDSIR